MIDSLYFKKCTLSTSVKPYSKPCFLQSDLRFSSALESSAYLKLTQLLVCSQQLILEHLSVVVKRLNQVGQKYWPWAVYKCKLEI